MSECYEIIKDEIALTNFVEWLPELERDEMYQAFLFARKKYANNPDLLKADKSQLKRFTSKKEFLINKIRQLEIKKGFYTQGSMSVPQESLVTYITVNPRSMERAAKQSLKKLADLVTTQYNGYNTHQIVMSEIQKSCGTKHFVDFDIGNTDSSHIKNGIRGVINDDSCKILETRGGVHLIVDTSKIDKRYEKSWYRGLTENFKCDVIGDNMIPIPGCVQGNFVPRFAD